MRWRNERYLFADELKLGCRCFCCGCPTFPCRFPWPTRRRLARFYRPAANLLFTIFDALRAAICGRWSIFDGVLLFRDPHVMFGWFPPRGFLCFFEAEFPNCNGFWPVLILWLWNFVLSSSVFVAREVACVCGLINQSMVLVVAPELQLQVIRIVGVEVCWTAFSSAIVGSACYSSPVSESRRLPGGCSRTCNVCYLNVCKKRKKEIVKRTIWVISSKITPSIGGEKWNFNIWM